MGIEEIQKDLEKHIQDIINACPISRVNSLGGSIEVNNLKKKIHVQLVPTRRKRY
jgi:hypothetical protein